MKRILSLLLVLTICQLSFGQVEVLISDATGNPNEVVEFDVRINGFTNISGMQFPMTWDSSIFIVEEITNISTDILQFDASSISTYTNPSVERGQLIVQWDLSSTQGVTVPSNHRLFTVKGKLLGTGGTSVVTLSPDIRPIEFLDENSNELTHTTNNGLLTVNGGGSANIVVNAPSVTASSGDQVCLSFKVDNFVNILSAQFPITYPTNILTYVSSSSPLPDATFNNNTVQGKITFLWNDNTAVNPQTIPNGGELINVCFNVIGSSGQVADIQMPNNIFPDIDFLNSGGENPAYEMNAGKVTVLGGSSDLTLYFDDTEVVKGQESCVSVKVKNFNNIQSMQFAMKWNQNELNYTSTGNYNTIVGVDAGAFNDLTPGKIIFAEFDQLGQGWNVPDDQVLFDICFTATKDCNELTTLEFSDDLQNGVEFTNIQDEILPYLFIAGNVKVICPCVIVDKNVSDVSCFGKSDGSINFNVEGATGNVNCTWSDNSITTCSPTGLKSGSYTVTIMDAAGCTSVADFQVNQPDELTITTSKTDEVNGCDGSIDATIAGGNGGYGFKWSNNATTEDLASLCKGEYTLEVTDSKGCTAISEKVVIDPKPMSVDDVTVENVKCGGDKTGSIELVVSGGCPKYDFKWEKEGEAINIPNENSISGLGAGKYFVTITDQSSPAQEIVQMYTVTEPNPLTISVDNIEDADVNDGAINITVGGGFAPYTYQWSPGDYMTQDISGIPSGKYTVTITDKNGCIIVSEEIEVGTKVIEVTLGNYNERFNGFGVSCKGECDGEVDGTFVRVNGDVTVQVNGVANTWPVKGLCAGDHKILITDAKGVTLDTTITIIEPDSLQAEFVNVSSCSDGKNGAATVQVVGGVEDYAFDWSSGSKSNASIDLPAGITNVVVTDANSCQYMLSLDMKECNNEGDDSCYKSIPVITPNGDGKNDLFVISCLNDLKNNLYVYDRYGNTVFTAKNYDNTWGGTHTDGSLLREQGYMWVLEVIKEDGGIDVYKGTVTILRDKF